MKKSLLIATVGVALLSNTYLCAVSSNSIPGKIGQIADNVKEHVKDAARSTEEHTKEGSQAVRDGVKRGLDEVEGETRPSIAQEARSVSENITGSGDTRNALLFIGGIVIAVLLASLVYKQL